MTPLGSFLFTYGFFAALVGGLVSIAMLGCGREPEFFERIDIEGRAVLHIVVGLLWPLVVLACVAWLLRALGRGVMQCVRLVRPTKTKLPRAEVRR